MLDLYIKLKNYDKNKPEISLQLAAQEIEQLNIGCKDLLVNGPVKCNPNSFREENILDEEGNITGTKQVPVLEGFLGDVNTILNDFGIVTVRIENYESFEWWSTPTTFIIVSGYPRRGEENNILPGEIA